MGGQGKSRHRWMQTDNVPAFLVCKFCKVEHTMGSEIGKKPDGSFWFRYPGGDWARYGKGKNLPPIPECPKFDDPPK